MAIKMNPLTEIVNRFPSRCAETGRHLLKGATVFHDAILKKAYHPESETVKKWKEAQAKAGKTAQAAAPGQGNDFIQDPGITDEDNWANQLY